MRKAILVAVSALLLVGPAFGEEKCELVQKASLDIEAGYNHVVVPAAIDGHPLKMEVDTAGYTTALTEKTARDLNLPIRSYGGMGGAYYGGVTITHYTVFEGFTLANMQARKAYYPLIPDGFLPPDINGLLASNFLASFDIDFDFGNGKMNLFSKDHCPHGVVYWTKMSVSMLPMRMDDALHVSTFVKLDGREVKAIIDTGASVTVMSLEAAQRLFHLKSDDPRLVPTEGPNHIDGARRFPFQKITFGNVEVTDPNIILVPDDKAKMGDNPDLILGMSILRQLHLYIAYGEKNIYVTSASQK